MIKLSNINKYYHKGKQNQNHVLNNISLEFEDTGLVVLIGPSGSGKTTLLNTISGMDNFHSGTFEIKDQVFQSYKSKRWDRLRKYQIGYIYQNYNILKEVTVYENIELVLKMVGITDEVELNKRVSHILHAVGLTQYHDRLSKQLSGGQQQRVAFARALAKDPDVILADEPTGNLDSKTTIELMQILKEISKEKLVILVTHEQVLADYFGDRIIEIENGKIMKDYKNDKQKDLSLVQEQIIYLKDYVSDTIKKDNLSIRHYQNTDEHNNLEIDLVERNDTVFVKVDANKARKISFIDVDSEVELLDESSKNANQMSEYDFRIKPIEKNLDKKVKSTITLEDSFIYAMRKIDVLSYGGKMLYVVLALVGVIASMSVGLLGETYRKDETYAEMNRNYVLLESDDLLFDDLVALEDYDHIDQVLLFGNEVEFSIQTNTYYTIKNTIPIESIPVDIQFFDETLLTHGSIPTGYGVIIDKSIADSIINNHQNRGIETYEDILECSFKLLTSGSDDDFVFNNRLTFPITGIADDNSNTVWLDEGLLYSLITPTLLDVDLLVEEFSIVEGTIPETQHYVMINNNSLFYEEETIPYQIGIATGEYEVSGVYRYSVDGEEYNLRNGVVTTKEFVKRAYFKTKYNYNATYNVLLYSNDIDATIDDFVGTPHRASNIFKTIDDENFQIKLSQNANIYIISITGIIVASISMYFIMRSSLLSRVYEVSVYRSLGASKLEITKMFLVEILIVSTLSTILGYIIMTGLLMQAEANSGETINLFHFTWWPFLAGIGGLYIINIVFGLIPIHSLLRKTPSDIVKKYDL